MDTIDSQRHHEHGPRGLASSERSARSPSPFAAAAAAADVPPSDLYSGSSSGDAVAAHVAGGHDRAITMTPLGTSLGDLSSGLGSLLLREALADGGRKTGSRSTASVTSVDSFSSVGSSGAGSVSSTGGSSEYASASGSFRDGSSSAAGSTSSSNASSANRRAASSSAREQQHESGGGGGVDSSNLTVQALKEMTRMRLMRQAQTTTTLADAPATATRDLPVEAAAGSWPAHAQQQQQPPQQSARLAQQLLEQGGGRRDLFVTATELTAPPILPQRANSAATDEMGRPVVVSEPPAFTVGSSPDHAQAASPSASAAFGGASQSSSGGGGQEKHQRPRPPALRAVDFSNMRNLHSDPIERERSGSSPVEYIPFSVAEYVLTSPRGSESSPTGLSASDAAQDSDDETDSVATLEISHAARNGSASFFSAARRVSSGRGKKKAGGGDAFAGSSAAGSGGGAGGRPEFRRDDSFGSTGSRGSAGSAGSKSSTSSVSSPRSPRTPTLTIDMSPLARKLYDLSQMNKRGIISSAEKRERKREVIRSSSSQERRSYYQTIHAAGAAMANSSFN